MSLTAMLLLVLSAFLHAGWNLLGKRAKSTGIFFFIAALAGSLFLLPFLILYHSALQFFSPGIWLLLIGTSFCLSVYYLGIVGAYRSGAISVAYPMLRALPVVLVTLLSIILGRGQELSPIALVGIGLIFLGVLGLPMTSFKDFTRSNYFNRSNLFALIAALGTVGYSLIDDTALRLVRTAADGLVPSWQIAISYAFFEALFSAVWLGIVSFVLILRGKIPVRELTKDLRPKALAGVGIYLNYTLVLISMAFVQNISYVVAFRQLSLPIGVLLGVLILKEHLSGPKLLGISVMFAGLILVSLG